LCERLGIRHRIAPMSDDSVQTMVRTESETLEFQQYFVREQCAPRIHGLEYRGAERAQPGEALGTALKSNALEGVILCPSNPYLSVAPILAIPGVRDALARHSNVIAVSPIVAGAALKGPAAKIMRELGEEASSLGIARYYRGVIRTLLIDQSDAALAPSIRELGIEPVVTDVVMRTPADRARLARQCAELARAS